MRVLLSAGEVSGDAIGAELARALKRSVPGTELAGCAGGLMVAQGVAPLASAAQFSHAGWMSVVSRLPWLAWKAWAYLRAVESWSPDMALVVDSPGLHGPLLRRLRDRGIPVAWVAPPQLWAWKNRRPDVLDGLVVYPAHGFEIDALGSAGAHPFWWGYPGPRPDVQPSLVRDKLALFPGTRPAWRRRHRELFARAAKLADLPLRAVFVDPHASTSGGEVGLPCMRPSQALAEAGLALSLPGTATLETALWGVPTLVAAQPGWFDLLVARRRLSEGFRALPNRILAQEIFPEHYAGQANAQYLARELRRVWNHRDAIRRRLNGFEDALGERDGARKVVEHFLETLGKVR